MALIICPECGKEISNLAPACIHCGFPLSLLDEAYKQKQSQEHQYTQNAIDTSAQDVAPSSNNINPNAPADTQEKTDLLDMIFVKLNGKASQYSAKRTLETYYGYPQGTSYAFLEQPGSILARGIEPRNIDSIKQELSDRGCIVDFVPSKETIANPLNSVWDGSETLEDVLEKQAHLKTTKRTTERENKNTYYCIALEEVRASGNTYYEKFCPLLELFPEACEDYPFKRFPRTIGTGLTKENAEWLQQEFRRARATANIQIDEDCTEPNIKANKYAEEERNGLIHCPRCGSTAVTTGQRGFSIVTGFIGSSKTTNRCSKCGNKWYPK